MAPLLLSDEVLITIVPIVAYWAFSGLYELLGYSGRYRLHPKAEEDEKNIVSRSTVIKALLWQQAVQIGAVLLALKFVNSGSKERKAPEPGFLRTALQFFAAMLLQDAWQYFWHRCMHANRFLFRHVHSAHHALVAPYAYGALYKNPAEFFILDVAGGSLSFLLSGMTPRAGMCFFTFATVKAVDLHSGLWLRWNPLRVLFANNSAYHDVHHQLKGHRYNFAQPFFVAWDRVLGTYMPFSVVERKGGGFEARLMKG